MPKVYDNQEANSKVIPKVGHWVRIKGGLYDKDLAVVEKIVSDEKICCKIIPRIEPNPKKNGSFMPQKKFRHIQR